MLARAIAPRKLSGSSCAHVTECQVKEDHFPSLYKGWHPPEVGIADGRLPSGTVLNIGQLADAYGVARETVQRSIRMLADEQLVTRFPGIGWQVD